MDHSRKFAAEAFGTFMLVSSVLGAALFATAAPSIAFGVAVSIGLTVMALAYALAPVSGAHFNPAVTLGLLAAGRFETSDVVGYIVAQCLGGIAAAAMFVFLIGTGADTDLARVSNGWGTLSPSNSGIVSVFITEVVMTKWVGGGCVMWMIWLSLASALPETDAVIVTPGTSLTVSSL